MNRSRIEKALRVAWAILKGQETFYPPFVQQFETDFAQFVGASFGVTFCNGTSTLEAALFAVGIKPGDEVLVPSYTFHASISPILNAGAKPIFVDIEARSLTLDLDDCKKKISPRTRAILIVHPWGYPADMAGVMALAKMHGLKVIEDASHAHGAVFAGKKVGAFGDVGCFSLQGNKTVNAGEGGVAVTSSKAIYERLLLFGHFGRGRKDFAESVYHDLDETGLGTKRRAHPLGIVLASVDLRDLPTYNARMKAWVSELEKIVEERGIGQTLKLHSGAERGGFYQGLLFWTSDVQHAEKLKETLRAAGIDTRGHPYGTFHRQPHLFDLEQRAQILDGKGSQLPRLELPKLPVTEDAIARVVMIPFYRPGKTWFTNRRTKNRIAQILKRI